MTRFVSLLAVTALLSGCARNALKSNESSHQAIERAPHADAPATAYAPPPPGSPAPVAGAAAPRAAIEAEAKSSRGEAYADSESRPGLGTSWGETRSSHVSSAPFERRDGDSPFSVTSIHYNDAKGVRAMSRGASLASAPRDGIDVANGALRVRFLDGMHRQLPTYDFGSQRYVVGRDGDRYIISLENRTGQRFEAVATVDGLDVVDGQPGSFAKRGYLVGPYQTIEIDGFRRSYDEVAAFRFGSVGESYAAQKGDDRNVGVVGIAFFAERGSEPVWIGREVERRREADPFPGRFATPPSNRWE
ncbi:MAG: hypothetical protein ACOY0T_36760 [Myxococcota bacterium]